MNEIIIKLEDLSLRIMKLTAKIDAVLKVVGNGNK